MAESRAATDVGAPSRGTGDRRSHVITLLHNSPEPLSVADIAKKVGIHVNTARFHLESLVYTNQANRQVESRPGPGRPRVVYSPIKQLPPHEPPRGFAQLAQILTGAVVETNPDAATWLYGVGQEWGRFLTTKSPPFAPVDEAKVASRVLLMLDELGFAPELDRAGDGRRRLWLHRCPFSQIARQRPGVPCQLHAGLVNGALAEMRSALRMVELEPHGATHECFGILGPVPDQPLASVPLRTDQG